VFDSESTKGNNTIKIVFSAYFLLIIHPQKNVSNTPTSADDGWHSHEKATEGRSEKLNLALSIKKCKQEGRGK
jgi:hypothetical protein